MNVCAVRCLQMMVAQLLQQEEGEEEEESSSHIRAFNTSVRNLFSHSVCTDEEDSVCTDVAAGSNDRIHGGWVREREGGSERPVY
jgi:hypothetical protein